MKADRIIAGLETIKRSFRTILADDAVGVIDEASAFLVAGRKMAATRHDKTHPKTYSQPTYWGYKVNFERPLSFRPSSTLGGLSLWVDICCSVLWEKEGELPKEQQVVVRVWSDDEQYQHRAEWDSEQVLQQLTAPERQHKGRVLLRCHFDLANPLQVGPKYHVQFGGNARDYELCWFPQAIDLPRLAYPPIDLVLACQLVGANFFADEYARIRETPEWVSAIRESQRHLLQGYYANCADVLRKEDSISLLDHLWNR